MIVFPVILNKDTLKCIFLKSIECIIVVVFVKL